MKSKFMSKLFISILLTAATSLIIVLLLSWILRGEWQVSLCMASLSFPIIFPIMHLLLSPSIYRKYFLKPQSPSPKAKTPEEKREEERKKKRSQNINKILVHISVLLGSGIVLMMIVFSGAGRFFKLWRQTNAIYALLGSIGAFFLYLIWSQYVKNQYGLAGGINSENKVQVDSDGGQSLIPETCSHCGEIGYHYWKGVGTKDFSLMCWKCQRIFSTVWCEKCGMGGDFVDMASGDPSDWFCPECKQIYTLPVDFFKYPIKLVPWETLGTNEKQGFEERQGRSQLVTARAVSWVIGAGIISFTLIEPMMDAFDHSLIKLGLGMIDEGLYTLLSCGSFLIFFLIIWFAFTIYPILIVNRYSRWRDQLNKLG